MISVSSAKKNKEQDINERIIELRKKINDEEYICNAIQRIAQVLSSKLVENSFTHK